MKKAVFRLLLTAALTTCGCQKELNWARERTDLPAPPTEEHYGFTLKENGIMIRGCIDTAYYGTANSIKALNIIGTDSAGKKLLITFFSPTSNFATGSYGSAANNATVKYGDYSTVAVHTAFSFEASAISDSLLTGTFSFIVSSLSTGLTAKITAGQIKAGIGKRNPC